MHFKPRSFGGIRQSCLLLIAPGDVVFAEWASCIDTEPLNNALGVEMVVAWKRMKLYSFLVSIQADAAFLKHTYHYVNPTYSAPSFQPQINLCGTLMYMANTNADHLSQLAISKPTLNK
ncbi:hypothetical protein ACLOJK_024897 [Asimina triloba]